MDDNKNFPYILGGENDCWQASSPKLPSSPQDLVTHRKVGDAYGSDFLSDMSAYSPPNNGIHQTSGGYHVSGRDLGSTHSQNTHQQIFNKGSLPSNSPQHMTWPTYDTSYTDKYSPPPFAAIDTECPRQQSMPAIFGDPSSTNYLGMHHGIPSNGWATDSAVPVLGEHMLCNGQGSSPETPYSNFSLSLSASDAMASMSLDTSMGSHAAGSTDITMACPATVSPKALRMTTSPAPTSLSESTHTNFFSMAEGEYSNASSLEQQYLPPVSGPAKRLNARGRKELPDKPLSSRFLPVSSPSSSSNSRRASDKHAVPHRPKTLADLKPKAPRSSIDELSDLQGPDLTVQTAERFKQDEFLIQSKLAGMTYREIKREGNFKEAESTLRGRYRTLTKPKTARVRKPEWTDKDIELLKRAVYKLTKGADLTTTKIPWKKVAEYISKNNGSYNFGFATCAKRWEELVAHEHIG